MIHKFLSNFSVLNKKELARFCFKIHSAIILCHHLCDTVNNHATSIHNVTCFKQVEVWVYERPLHLLQLTVFILSKKTTSLKLSRNIQMNEKRSFWFSVRCLFTFNQNHKPQCKIFIILGKQCVTVWTGFMCLRINFSHGFLLTC